MTAEPSPSVTVTSPEAARSTRVAFWPVRMSTPWSAQRVGDLLAGEDLLPAEQPVLALDQRDLRAERRVGLAHLDADDAAAHDDQARRDRLRGRGLAVGPRLGLAEPVDRRERRRRAAGEDHRRAGLDLLLADDDAVRPGEPAPAAEEVDVALLEPGQLRAVVEVVDDLVAAGEQRGDVQLARGGLGRARDAARLRQRLGRAQERLRRHARPVRALAADLAILDDRHLEPALGEPPRRHLAARARAQHHHVVAPHGRTVPAPGRADAAAALSGT